jgi:predicted nucleic acid-binding protein
LSDAPFLDTNVLIYAYTSDSRYDQAYEIVSKPFLTSVQALNEFASVARRKFRMEWSEIRSFLNDIQLIASRISAVGIQAHLAALDLVEKYNLNFYDALMIAAALEAGSTTFVSEDMQNGLVIEGRLTIVNPFLPA